MTPKKRFFYLLIIIGCIVIVISSGLFLSESLQIGNRADQTAVLQLVTERIEIQYPKNWQAMLTPRGNHGDLDVAGLISGPVDFFIPTKNIVLARKFLNGGNKTIEDWGDERIKLQFATYSNISLSNFSTQHFSGSVREYLVPPPGIFYNKNAWCKDFYFTYLDNSFDFSFCSVEEKWDEAEIEFDKIMNSVKPLEIK